MESVFDSDAFQRSLFFPRRGEGTVSPTAIDMQVRVAPAATIHARWHRHSGSRATVVLFHGNGEIVGDYDDAAARYRDEVRADLVVIEYRGYGLSSGTPTLRTCIGDAVPALQAVRAELAARAPAPWIVLGRSLGGACAAEIAGQLPPLADAIIMESAGADPISLLARRGLRPRGPLTEDETNTFDPRPKLARCTLPVLVLHGTNDEIIAADEARVNFDAIGTSRKQLVLIADRGHNDVVADARYWTALDAFVTSIEPR